MKTAVTRGIRKGDSVRIVNVHLGEDRVARRYLDRTGTVQKISRKNSAAEVLFNNRVSPLEIPLRQLERA